MTVGSPSRGQIRVAILIGMSLGAVSLLRPLSFDEMYWLTIARRWFGAGDLPYFELLDNKGPLLYVLMGGADLLPLSERGFMSVLSITAAAAFAAGAIRLAKLARQPGRWPLYSAGLSVFVVTTLSVYAVTTELLTATTLIWAFASRRGWLRIALLVAACLVDPRALLFAPVVLVHGRGRGQLTSAQLSAFVAIAVVGVGAVLAIPTLRYSFVEASLATRFEAYPLDRILVSVAAVSPLVALATTRASRIPGHLVAVGVLAALVGVSAGLPYGHYWVYVSLIPPLLPIDGPRMSSVVRASVTALVCITLVLAVQSHWFHDVDQAAIDDPLAVQLATQVNSTDSVLIISSTPNLRYRLGAQTLGYAPTSNYLAWGLPASDRLIDRFRTDLETADMLVIDERFEQFDVVPTVREALDLAADRALESSCSFRFDSVTVYRLSGC